MTVPEPIDDDEVTVTDPTTYEGTGSLSAASCRKVSRGRETQLIALEGE
jgi:hypothetical protein